MQGRACRSTALLALAAAAWVWPTQAAAGQDTHVTARDAAIAQALAQAESAFDQRDLPTAERQYAAVLALDRLHPRALFRLAQLRRRDPDAAIALLQKYIAIVPADAWGHLALAEAFARRGASRRALEAYAEARAHEPTDRDILLGWPRLLEQLRRPDEAISAYEAWLDVHPADVEAWQELVDVQLRAGRPRAATRTLERAILQSPRDDLAAQVERLRIHTPPVLHLGLIASADTDAVGGGLSVGVDVPTDRLGRVGLQFQQQRVRSLDRAARIRRMAIQVSGRPTQTLRVDAGGGIRWSTPVGPTGSRQLHPDVGLRIRRSVAGSGPNVDVRLQHDPIQATPELALMPVSRSQAAAGLEAPAGGPWRVLGEMRVASLTRQEETNRRTDMGAGIGLRVAPELMLSGRWRRSRNSTPTVRGYFAPSTADLAEMGVTLEREYERTTVALDAAGGVQRFQRTQASERGAWAPALRLWGLLTWRIGTGRELLVEVDSYDSHHAASVVPVDRWWHTTVTASLRLAIR